MKLIFVFCVIFCLSISNIHNVHAEHELDCLERIVEETVGYSPKYTFWFDKVAANRRNVATMMATCANLPPKLQEWPCYRKVDRFTKRATDTLMKRLSEVEPSKNWTEITKPCIKVNEHILLE